MSSGEAFGAVNARMDNRKYAEQNLTKSSEKVCYAVSGGDVSMRVAYAPSPLSVAVARCSVMTVISGSQNSRRYTSCIPRLTYMYEPGTGGSAAAAVAVVAGSAVAGWNVTNPCTQSMRLMTP